MQFNFPVGVGPRSILIVYDAQLHYSARSVRVYGFRSTYVGGRACALLLRAAVGTPLVDAPSEKDVAGRGRRILGWNLNHYETSKTDLSRQEPVLVPRGAQRVTRIFPWCESTCLRSAPSRGVPFYAF